MDSQATMATSTAEARANELMELIWGYTKSQALYVAARLGI